MKLVRFLPWSVVFIGFILATVWYFRIDIVSSILDRVVQTTEIQHLDYQLESISTTAAFFSDLTFEISSQQARYHISFENLKVTFTVDNLGSGRVERVDISNLTVQEERRGGNRDQLNNDALFLTLVSVLDRSLPFESIAIDELYFSSGALTPTQSHPIQLNAYSTPAGMSAELYHHQRTLEIKTAKNTLDLNLKDREQQSILELILTLDYSEAEGLKGIFGNLDLRTGHVLDWWKTLVPSTGPVMEGGVAGQFHAEPAAGGWRLRVNGTTEQLTWKEVVVRNGLLILDAEIPDILDFDDSVVRFNTGSQFTAENMEFRSFAMADMALVFNGELVIDKNFIEFVTGDNNSFSSNRLGWKDNHFNKLEINPTLRLRYDPDGWVIHIRDGFATVREFRAGQYHLASGKAYLQSPMRFALARHAPPDGWVIDRGRISIPEFSLAGKGLKVNSEDLTLEAEVLTPDRYTFSISAMNTEARKNSIELELGSLYSQIELDGHQLAADGSFTLTRFPGHYPFQLDADLQKNSGGYTVRQTGSVDLLEEATEINSLLADWAPGWYVTQGALSFAVNGHWDNNKVVSNRVDVNVRDAAGGYSGASFAGMDFQGPLYFPPVPHSESATIEVETIVYGVVAENIVSDIRLSASKTGTRPGVRLDRLEGEILGSRLVCENCSFDPGSSVNRLGVSLSGLNIGEPIKLLKIDGLDARGKIDGRLPVEISEGGIHIKKGEIWNQEEGGIIQYIMEPGQAESLSNRLTDSVIRALEDFDYDVLTGSVEYEPDGNLRVKLHIEGTSPNNENAQPIHLNINTEQNMLLLLKSLGYAEKLSDKILDQVHYQLNQDQAN